MSLKKVSISDILSSTKKYINKNKTKKRYICMYWCMTTSMYCLYVGVDYTYTDVNTLAQGIKSFLASHVWFQAVAGVRTYGTDSPAITSQPC